MSIISCEGLASTPACGSDHSQPSAATSAIYVQRHGQRVYEDLHLLRHKLQVIDGHSKEGDRQKTFSRPKDGTSALTTQRRYSRRGSMLIMHACAHH